VEVFFGKIKSFGRSIKNSAKKTLGKAKEMKQDLELTAYIMERCGKCTLCVIKTETGKRWKKFKGTFTSFKNRLMHGRTHTIVTEKQKSEFGDQLKAKANRFVSMEVTSTSSFSQLVQEDRRSLVRTLVEEKEPGSHDENEKTDKHDFAKAEEEMHAAATSLLEHYHTLNDADKASLMEVVDSVINMSDEEVEVHNQESMAKVVDKKVSDHLRLSTNPSFESDACAGVLTPQNLADSVSVAVNVEFPDVGASVMALLSGNILGAAQALTPEILIMFTGFKARTAGKKKQEEAVSACLESMNKAQDDKNLNCKDSRNLQVCVATAETNLYERALTESWWPAERQNSKKENYALKYLKDLQAGTCFENSKEAAEASSLRKKVKSDQPKSEEGDQPKAEEDDYDSTTCPMLHSYVESQIGADDSVGDLGDIWMMTLLARAAYARDLDRAAADNEKLGFEIPEGLHGCLGPRPFIVNYCMEMLGCPEADDDGNATTATDLVPFKTLQKYVNSKRDSDSKAEAGQETAAEPEPGPIDFSVVWHKWAIHWQALAITSENPISDFDDHVKTVVTNLTSKEDLKFMEEMTEVEQAKYSKDKTGKLEKPLDFVMQGLQGFFIDWVCDWAIATEFINWPADFDVSYGAGFLKSNEHLSNLQFHAAFPLKAQRMDFKKVVEKNKLYQPACTPMLPMSKTDPEERCSAEFFGASRPSIATNGTKLAADEFPRTLIYEDTSVNIRLKTHRVEPKKEHASKEDAKFGGARESEKSFEAMKLYKVTHDVKTSGVFCSKGAPIEFYLLEWSNDDTVEWGILDRFDKKSTGLISKMKNAIKTEAFDGKVCRIGGRKKTETELKEDAKKKKDGMETNLRSWKVPNGVEASSATVPEEGGGDKKTKKKSVLSFFKKKKKKP